MARKARSTRKDCEKGSNESYVYTMEDLLKWNPEIVTNDALAEDVSYFYSYFFKYNFTDEQIQEIIG